MQIVLNDLPVTNDCFWDVHDSSITPVVGEKYTKLVAPIFCNISSY